MTAELNKNKINNNTNNELSIGNKTSEKLANIANSSSNQAKPGTKTNSSKIS